MSDAPNPGSTKAQATLAQLDGSEWKGAGELWLDPSGDDPYEHPCAATIEGHTLTYAWSKGDTSYQGTITWSADGGTFEDAFHQSERTPCAPLASAKAEVALGFDYDAGEGPQWGWRVLLSVRPTGQLVLQMINVAPWGEEARAARMVFERA